MSRKKGKQRARDTQDRRDTQDIRRGSTTSDAYGSMGSGGEGVGNAGGMGGVTYVPLTKSSTPSSIVSAALAQAGESSIGQQRGSLDRGTLAQCLNATSQIAAECNRILRELLRGCGSSGAGCVFVLRVFVFLCRVFLPCVVFVSHMLHI